MRVSRVLQASLVLAALIPSASCLFHTRKVEVRQSTAPLLSASADELIARINRDASKITTLNATVNIDSSVGGEKKGQVTQYQQISGYILLREPNMLRMIGLYPLVRNKAFDMVSDGTQFKLSIPVLNKFYVGHNDVTRLASNPLENIRPQYIYDALLLQPINPENEIAVLESSSETVVDKKTKQLVKQPTYVVDVIRRDANNKYYLTRKVILDRSDLIPDTQVIYDRQGNPSTEARYQAYKDFSGVSFPTVIQIRRPQEEYEIQLTIVKLTLNEPLTNEQFALEQPPGSQLVNMDQQNTNANSGGGPTSRAPVSAESNRTAPHR